MLTNSGVGEGLGKNGRVVDGVRGDQPNDAMGDSEALHVRVV